MDQQQERPRPADEGEFWQAVRSGDLEYVRQNCRQRKFSGAERLGALSRDPVTDQKYRMIVTTSMTARLCAESGLEMEQAFRLCGFYIQKLDGIHTAEDVEALRDSMLLDFTGKMRLLTRNAGASAPIAGCIDYIYAHIRERITVEDLARLTGLSASHLSRLFKKETGISVSDYIREKKVEKAQDLLRYGDDSLVEISNYLSFSSQSHFTQLFRTFTGMTPKKYRDLCAGRWVPPAGQKN